MTQVFGTFVEPEHGTKEYLKIGFSPSSVPLQQRWRNNGLSADFLADYLSTFFPGDNDEALDKQAQIKDAVNYIANELLENAMRFNYAPAQHPVDITMELRKDSVCFYVTNSIDPEATDIFQHFIQRLLTEDPSEIYIEQITRNADDEANGDSGLGYLTMLNDYDAELSWKFTMHTEDVEVALVTTMVRLPI